MKKLGGYLLMLVGLVFIIIRFFDVGIILPLSDSLLLIGGIVLLVIGFFLTLKKVRKQKHKEVPIYEEEEVIGYRRLKKK